MSNPKGAERRRSPRRPIMDSFSLFIVVPKKGVHRLEVHDVSDSGLGFSLDMPGESTQEFPVSKGESIDIHFYLNQSLFLPLTLSVVRFEEKDGVRRVGTEFKDKTSKAYFAYKAFLQMLDAISEAARLTL